VRRAVTLSITLALGSCGYNVETLPECFTENIPASIRAIGQVMRAGDYKGGNVEIEHTLCSTHGNRLANAERLLTAAGFQHDTGPEELGKCIHVRVNSPLAPQALDKQITTFCGIAAGSRIAYVSWSGMVGEKSIYVSGNYVSILRKGELPKPF
jgi:hypothetical protein